MVYLFVFYARQHAAVVCERLRPPRLVGELDALGEVEEAEADREVLPRARAIPSVARSPVHVEELGLEDQLGLEAHVVELRGERLPAFGLPRRAACVVLRFLELDAACRTWTRPPVAARRGEGRGGKTRRASGLSRVQQTTQW